MNPSKMYISLPHLLFRLDESSKCSESEHILFTIQTFPILLLTFIPVYCSMQLLFKVLSAFFEPWSLFQDLLVWCWENFFNFLTSYILNLERCDIKGDIISTRQRKMRINCTLIIKHKWIVKDNVFDMFAQMIFDIKDGNSNSLNLIIIFFMLRWTNILFMKDDNQWHLLVVLKLLRSWL